MFISHCDIDLLLDQDPVYPDQPLYLHAILATILSHSHLKDDSSPHISGSGSSNRINLTFVLFKHVILM